MALWKRYLHERRWGFAAWALSCAVFAVVFALYHLPMAAIVYPALLCAGLGCLFAVADYRRFAARQRWLARLPDQPALLAEALPPAAGAEGEAYRALVLRTCHALAEQEQAADARYRDTVDYFTVWAHQVKTPIASMRLTLQNEDTALARRLSADLFRIEQYVDMVLAFLRLGSPATDYVFRPCAVDAIVREAAKKFASLFIDRHIRFDYAPVGITVVSDEKWLAFVLEQLLSNALKYTPDGGCIRIFAGPAQTLCIEDTGIGIAPEDLPRIFEKGYTGCNGRKDKRASGLGLYLCKRVCDGLGIGIRVQSAIGQGTRVTMDLKQYELKRE